MSVSVSHSCCSPPWPRGGLEWKSRTAVPSQCMKAQKKTPRLCPWASIAPMHAFLWGHEPFKSHHVCIQCLSFQWQLLGSLSKFPTPGGTVLCPKAAGQGMCPSSCADIHRDFRNRKLIPTAVCVHEQHMSATSKGKQHVRQGHGLGSCWGSLLLRGAKENIQRPGTREPFVYVSGDIQRGVEEALPITTHTMKVFLMLHNIMN